MCVYIDFFTILSVLLPLHGHSSWWRPFSDQLYVQRRRAAEESLASNCGVSPKKTKGEESAGQADLSGKQQSDDGEEYGQDEEHVGGAHHRVVGQLVRLPTDLFDVEADGEDEGGHAEQDHCDGGTERRWDGVLHTENKSAFHELENGKKIQTF